MPASTTRRLCYRRFQKFGSTRRNSMGWHRRCNTPSAPARPCATTARNCGWAHRRPRATQRRCPPSKPNNPHAPGAGPRGVAILVRPPRVHAWLEGRAAIVPEALRTVFVDTIAHRLALQPVYEAQRAEIARPLAAEILRRVAAP